MVSMTSIPVCTGSLTKSRSMIAGAGRSIGLVASAAIGPPPSSGRPSGSTMRPSSAGPTGTRTTSPVPRTRSPASTPSLSSSRTQPSRRGRASAAKPNWPRSKRSSSSSRTSGRPETSAMPSATARHGRTPRRRRRASSRGRARSRVLSQASRSAGSVTVQLLANAIEVGPPVVAHDAYCGRSARSPRSGRDRCETQDRIVRRATARASPAHCSVSASRQWRGGDDLERCSVADAASARSRSGDRLAISSPSSSRNASSASRRKAPKQTPRDIDRKLAGAIDERPAAAARSRAIGASASLRRFATPRRACVETRRLLGLGLLRRLRDQPRRARRRCRRSLLRLGARLRRLLARRVGFGEQARPPPPGAWRRSARPAERRTGRASR